MRRNVSGWRDAAMGIAVLLAVPGLVFLILAAAVLLVLLSPALAIALTLTEDRY